MITKLLISHFLANFSLFFSFVVVEYDPRIKSLHQLNAHLELKIWMGEGLEAVWLWPVMVKRSVLQRNYVPGEYSWRPKCHDIVCLISKYNRKAALPLSPLSLPPELSPSLLDELDSSVGCACWRICYWWGVCVEVLQTEEHSPDPPILPQLEERTLAFPQSVWLNWL